MGENSEQTGCLYVRHHGESELKRLCTATDFLCKMEPTIETKNYSRLNINMFNDVSFRVNMKLPKCMRCHDRKRFTKLLMSIGVPRNAAVKISPWPGQSYSAAWMWIVLLNLCYSPKQ